MFSKSSPLCRCRNRLGEVETPGVGKNHPRILLPAAEIVDHHSIKHAGFGIFSLHIELHVWNVAVERAFGNFHLRRLLAHGEQERPHLGLRHRQHIVLEKESRNGHQYHENCQRLHDAEQRYARSLHGRELEFLAEISEHHKRGQQHGQRQRHGNHGECRIEKQLGDYADLQPLAHKVVDALPEELHHDYEQADEECHGEQRQEALKHVAV